MTQSIAVATSRRARPPSAPATAADDIASALLTMLESEHRIRFPSSRYRDDPVAFCREILGVEPWSAQVQILETVRDQRRVAVSSGHKVGKSRSAAMLALWYFCSYDDARVVMSSTTARQVDQILWREVKMLRARGGRCRACVVADPEGRRIVRPCPHSTLIDGEIGELARTGLKSEDFREIVGFTAREAEAVAGISGKNLLYLIDEASGVPEEIFQAIEGNRAGGARICMFSNPTRTSGEFFDAFHKKRAFYATITVSSESTPNVVAGSDVIPGLAGREWIEEKRLEWGEESPMYKIRVKGEHALSEDGKIFSVHAIAEAEQRWADTEATGRLFIGLDPAGESGQGDETAWCVRRGLKVLELVAARGLSTDAIIVRTEGLIAKYAAPREVPVLVVDRLGSIGAELYGKLRAQVPELETAIPPWELVGVRSSDNAVRQPKIYARIRDELAANLEAWVRDGGAIVEDARLAAELHAIEWSSRTDGKLRVTPKDEIRKDLERSPDRMDALALSVWEPLYLRDEIPGSAQHLAAAERQQAAPATVDGYDADDASEIAMDPYATIGAWSGR